MDDGQLDPASGAPLTFFLMQPVIKCAPLARALYQGSPVQTRRNVSKKKINMAAQTAERTLNTSSSGHQEEPD